MRVIVDAMGGDNAPYEIVKGAVDAQKEFGIDITLVGRLDDIEESMRRTGIQTPHGDIDIVNAAEVITMEDDPSTAVRRKKDSSMAVALRLLGEGAGDACVSAGSTGALLTGATLTLKRISGIRRAALAPVIPNGDKGALLIDGGANVECTSEYLLQFAFMGSFYAKNFMGCSSPRVGLLNVGSEETKGTELYKETYGLLAEMSGSGRINFIGNVEARDVMSGEADVIVADGFSGNVLLKSIEGTAMFLMKNIRDIFKSGVKNQIAGALVKDSLKGLKKMMDSSEVGGTPLLGISRPVIKAHGSSNARAIRSAVRQAIGFTEAGIIDEIEKNIAYMKISEKA